MRINWKKKCDEFLTAKGCKDISHQSMPDKKVIIWNNHEGRGAYDRAGANWKKCYENLQVTYMDHKNLF